MKMKGSTTIDNYDYFLKKLLYSVLRWSLQLSAIQNVYQSNICSLQLLAFPECLVAVLASTFPLKAKQWVYQWMYLASKGKRRPCIFFSNNSQINSQVNGLILVLSLKRCSFAM